MMDTTSELWTADTAVNQALSRRGWQGDPRTRRWTLETADGTALLQATGRVGGSGGNRSTAWTTAGGDGRLSRYGFSPDTAERSSYR